MSTIAGAIKTRPRRAERIRHETFSGELRTLQVAARETRATDVKLTGDTDRQRIERVVEYVNLRVLNGFAIGAMPPSAISAVRGML